MFSCSCFQLLLSSVWLLTRYLVSCYAFMFEFTGLLLSSQSRCSVSICENLVTPAVDRIELHLSPFRHQLPLVWALMLAFVWFFLEALFEGAIGH